jgi:hypothetical protein
LKLLLSKDPRNPGVSSLFPERGYQRCFRISCSPRPGLGEGLGERADQKVSGSSTLVSSQSIVFLKSAPLLTECGVKVLTRDSRKSYISWIAPLRGRVVKRNNPKNEPKSLFSETTKDQRTFLFNASAPTVIMNGTVAKSPNQPQS